MVFKSPSRAEVKRTARFTLSSSDVKLDLIYGILICLTACVSLHLVFSCLQVAIYYMAPKGAAVMALSALDIVMQIIAFLILSPLLLGFYALAAGRSHGKKTRLLTVFYWFSSFKQLMRAWAVVLLLLLPFLLINGAFNIAISCIDVYLGGLTLPKMLTVIASVALALACFIIWGRFYTLINAVVCGGDATLKTCMRKALASTKGRAFKIFALRVSFIPWIILSFCTIGVLFPIFTLPYMAVCYSQYSAYLITNENRIYNTEDQ